MGNKRYKVYRGMASSEAQVNWRGKTSTPEGISTTIPYKGDVNTIFIGSKGGIQSGMSYSGAWSIPELQAKAKFIQQTIAGQAESFTHILFEEQMSEDHYGTKEKMVQFADLDKRHADLRLRLHYDGLTQGQFFRALVTGYVDRDPDIVNFIEKVKENSENISQPLWKK